MRSLGADRSMDFWGSRGCGDADGAVFSKSGSLRALPFSGGCRGRAFTCLRRADIDFRSEAFTRLRRASHFPLSRQRKVTKGKTTPASAQDELRPSCSPRCSSPTGRQTTRPSMASDSVPFPGGRLRSSALLRGVKVKSHGTRFARRTGLVATSAVASPAQRGKLPAGLKGALLPALGNLAQSNRSGCIVVLRYLRTNDKGVRCLFRRHRRALDLGSPASVPRSGAGHRGKANCLRPGMAELVAGRWPASTAGHRAGKARSARMPGCPSLWLLSLGQARESDPLAAEASGTRVQHHRFRAEKHLSMQNEAQVRRA